MHILITGGAGFIGANLAAALLRDGYRVTLYDNLSRPGAAHNLAWLTREFGQAKVVLRKGDIRDARSTADALADADAIIHLAGQVAVTTSVVNPREDFDINAWVPLMSSKQPVHRDATRFCSTRQPTKSMGAWTISW